MKESNVNYHIIYGRKSQRVKEMIFVREDDFQIPLGEESFKTPLDLLKKIQNTEIHGKKLPALFSYQDISLWWFIHATFFPQFKKTVNFVTKFLEFLDQIQPSKVQIDGDFDKFEIIKQICEKRQIKFSYAKISLLRFRIINNILWFIQKYRHEKIFKTKVKKRIDLFHNNNAPRPSLNDKIVFAVSTLYRRTIFNPKKGSTEKGEYIQQAIIDLIDDKSKIVGIDLDYTFKGDFDTLVERLKEKIPWFPVEVLASHKITDHKEFLRNYDVLISSEEFQTLFNYKGISLWSQVRKIFQQMTLRSFLPFYLNLIDSLEDVFAKEKPKVIFIPYETGPLGLSLIVSSKRFGIKTVGVQHASVYRNNPMYSFDQFDSPTNPHGFPLPHKLLLFGEFSKQILEEQLYPTEKLIVFGNPYFFSMDKIESILSTIQLHEKYGIDKKKYVILFASALLQEYYQAQGKYDYDTQVWEYLLQNFGGKTEYEIILKPHPNENTDIYKKIVRKYNYANVKIVQGDLFELIYISSVVVSVFSTFMLDSLCFKKPVIRVKFSDEEPIIPYDKFSVIVTTELNKLSEKINNILQNPEIKDNLFRNLESFLKSQYNIPNTQPGLIIQKLIE